MSNGDFTEQARAAWLSILKKGYTVGIAEREGAGVVRVYKRNGDLLLKEFESTPSAAMIRAADRVEVVEEKEGGANV